MLDIYGMVVAVFLVTNKANHVIFFKYIFSVTNVSLEIVLEMFFLTLSNADIDFLDWKLRWKTYITKKALPTIKHIELVRKEDFVAVALDPKHKTFVVHIISFSTMSFSSTSLNMVHTSRKPQISDLITEKAPTKVLDKYVDFANVFSLDLAVEPPKYIGINKHTIKLVDG